MKQLFSRLSNFFAPKNEPDQPTSSGSGIDRALSLQKTQDIHHTAPQILRIIAEQYKKKFSGGNKNETVYFFSKYATGTKHIKSLKSIIPYAAQYSFSRIDSNNNIHTNFHGLNYKFSLLDTSFDWDDFMRLNQTIIKSAISAYLTDKLTKNSKDWVLEYQLDELNDDIALFDSEEFKKELLKQKNLDILHAFIEEESKLFAKKFFDIYADLVDEYLSAQKAPELTFINMYTEGMDSETTKEDQSAINRAASYVNWGGFVVEMYMKNLTSDLTQFQDVVASRYLDRVFRDMVKTLNRKNTTTNSSPITLKQQPQNELQSNNRTISSNVLELMQTLDVEEQEVLRSSFPLSNPQECRFIRKAIKAVLSRKFVEVSVLSERSGFTPSKHQAELVLYLMKKHHLQELKSETEILESSVKETNTKESNTKETVRDSKPTIDVSGFDLYSAEGFVEALQQLGFECDQKQLKQSYTQLFSNSNNENKKVLEKTFDILHSIKSQNNTTMGRIKYFSDLYVFKCDLMRSGIRLYRQKIGGKWVITKFVSHDDHIRELKNMRKS